jgi:hypothetical protein
MQRQPTLSLRKTGEMRHLLSAILKAESAICAYRGSICMSPVTQVAGTSGSEAVTFPRCLDVT